MPEIVREHPGLQAIGRGVDEPHRLIEFAVPLDHDHRREDLL